MRSVVMLMVLVTLLSPGHAQEMSLALSDDVAELTLDNIASLEPIESFDRDTREILVSPDGQLVAVATQHQDFDYGISIYEVMSSQEISSIQGRMDFVREML